MQIVNRELRKIGTFKFSDLNESERFVFESTKARISSYPKQLEMILKDVKGAHTQDVLTLSQVLEKTYSELKIHTQKKN